MDGACVITLRGEVDMANAAEILDDLRRAFDESGSRSLTLDLSELGFLGSDGLRILIRLYDRLRTQGSPMTVVNPTPIVRNILEITGLSEILLVD